jgi:hypothetical protein
MKAALTQQQQNKHLSNDHYQPGIPEIDTWRFHQCE